MSQRRPCFEGAELKNLARFVLSCFTSNQEADSGTLLDCAAMALTSLSWPVQALRGM